MFIIAGLGNPGLKYRNTRHNAGFIAMDYLAKRLKIRMRQKKFQATVGEGTIGGEKVLLLKPETYMNLSGDSLADAVYYYKIPTDHVIILYDDIDLDLGRLRIREKGSAGTHNGMRSIIGKLRTQEFPRVRIGVGKPPGYMKLADFVLAKVSKQEKQELERACEEAALAAQEIVEQGIAYAQERHNGEKR